MSPRRIPSYCNYPLCPDQVEKPGARFCGFHASLTRKNRRREKQRRGEVVSSSRHGYSRRWREARSRYLKRHPLCINCLARGDQIEATVVDHIVPHKRDHDLFWDHSNWQALCAPCHNRKTGEETRARLKGKRQLREGEGG